MRLPCRGSLATCVLAIEERLWSPPPPEATTWLHRVSGGNPLFLGMLLEKLEGTYLTVDGPAARWQAPPAQLEVNLRSWLARELAELGPTAADFLALAAVVGERFPYNLVKSLFLGEEAQLEQTLDQLVRMGWLQESWEAGVACHRFTHNARWQAAHSQMEKRRARRLAGLVGAFLEFPQSGVADWQRAADFYEQAGDSKALLRSLTQCLLLACEVEDWPLARGWMKRCQRSAATVVERIFPGPWYHFGWIGLNPASGPRHFLATLLAHQGRGDEALWYLQLSWEDNLEDDPPRLVENLLLRVVFQLRGWVQLERPVVELLAEAQIWLRITDLLRGRRWPRRWPCGSRPREAESHCRNPHRLERVGYNSPLTKGCALEVLVDFFDAHGLGPGQACARWPCGLELLSPQSAIVAGAPLQLGVRFKMDEHWHVYWKNPGVTGYAPRFEWKLPAGWKPGEIEWPVPQRLVLADLQQFVYDREVLLTTQVPVPADFKSSQPVKLGLKVEWLACAETCIEARPRWICSYLWLPVLPPSSAQALFESVRTQLPASPGNITLRAWRVGPKQAFLEYPGDAGDKVDFYPDSNEANMDSAPVWKAGQGLTIPIGEKDTQLLGVLSIEKGGQRLGLQLDVPIAASAPAKPLNAALPVVTADGTLLGTLLAAFVGGMILNLMPCVFPVLSLKALSLVRHNEHGSKPAWLQGWVYTAGVLVSVWAIAFPIMLLKSSSQSLGWGYQMQSPVFVTFLAILFSNT